ncbi:hypothetical protein ASG01_01785 [Chryseobacterium sp. Leaf180]|uniref:hypothetical protein n=1 Tax=Chryseobacterium sp. Leaf180 TaxID=1736289 RepID=UPI0006FB8243|nr:hypothetical protein [Chryseobacterium sp. Leaf180]KQR94635.1 hypothetical protein ASG01_01785 [Chryseobacterium sp. Leaf180]
MKEFEYITGVFDLRKKKLIITDGEILMKVGKNNIQTIKKDDLESVRYGVEFIKGLELYIGREYLFYFKPKQGKQIKVNFKSFYRYKLKEKHQLYNDIINTLWDVHLYNLTDAIINKVLSGEVVTISGVSISMSGISIGKEIINYKDLQIKYFYDYLAVSSVSKPDICRLMYFSKDENAVVAGDILSYLIKKSNEEKSAQ